VQPIAVRVVLERFYVLTRVFQRLAEREAQVDAVRLRNVRPRELRTHRGDLPGREAQRLDVGERPPGLADARREFDGVPVGCNVLVPPAGRP
jgi:hypothetical protein